MENYERYEPAVKDMTDDEFRWYLREYEEWIESMEENLREQWFAEEYLHTD